MVLQRRSSLLGNSSLLGGRTAAVTGLGTAMRRPTPGLQPSEDPEPPVVPPPTSTPAPAPTPTPAVGSYMPEGVNLDKWNDASHTSPKYTVLQVLSKYPNTPAGLLQALPELQALDPDAKVLGDDTIDLPNLLKGMGDHSIDVIRAAGEGGKAWQWGVDTEQDSATDMLSQLLGGTAAPASMASTTPGFPVPGAASGGGTGGGSGVPGASNPGADGAIEEIIRQIISGRGALGTSLEGTTSDTIKRIIDQGGALNQDRLTERIGGAREAIEKARTSMTDQLDADLASRGINPGLDPLQGGGRRRLTENLGSEFSTALRDIEVNESQAADQRLQSALELATGMGRDQAQTLLGAIGAGNQRQAVLAQVAVEQLKNNTQWNMFLANYGLDRDKLMLDVQNGRMQNILPILQLFLSTIQTGAHGTVPDPDTGA